MAQPTIRKVAGTVTWTDGTTTKFSVVNVSGQWTWQQGVPARSRLTDQDLGQRGFGDGVLDKLTEAVAAHVAENTPTTHWHVGCNVEGYLADAVACFDDPDEARDYLESEMSNTQDGLPECAAPADNGAPCDECAPCKAHVQIDDNINALGTDDVTQGVRYTYNDGRALDIAQWIEVVPAADCEEDRNPAQ